MTGRDGRARRPLGKGSLQHQSGAVHRRQDTHGTHDVWGTLRRRGAARRYVHRAGRRTSDRAPTGHKLGTIEAEHVRPMRGRADRVCCIYGDTRRAHRDRPRVACSRVRRPAQQLVFKTVERAFSAGTFSPRFFVIHASATHTSINTRRPATRRAPVCT